MLEQEIEYHLSKTEVVLNENLTVLENISAPEQKHRVKIDVM
jgi:hypothetical protein